MAANVRFRSTYYNTTGPAKTTRIEILDTEPVWQVTEFQSVSPNASFEGLNENIKPGIYPTSYKFGMYIREQSAVRDGVTYGRNDDIFLDLFQAAEGRFLVRVYEDEIFKFIGPMIYDQCSYEDNFEPYLLNITAVDGMVKWQTQKYISPVGQIKTVSFTQTDTVYSNTPLTGYVGTEWVLIENRVTSIPHDFDATEYHKITTYARLEIYSPESPGTGWVDQGNGLWAKAVSYTNEYEDEDLTPGQEYYVFTRDINASPHRIITDIFEDAMSQLVTMAEYPAGTVMYDTACAWYEQSMADFFQNPYAMTKLHEKPFLGGTWNEALQEICRLFNIRIYYSNGRYHFEQINFRINTVFKRFKYQYDGTLIGEEYADLDLDYDTVPLRVGVGGVYKTLAPVRKVEVSVTLDSNNLLQNVIWKEGDEGQKYLGRITKTAGNQYLFLKLTAHLTSTFDPTILLIMTQPFIDQACLHRIVAHYEVRITNTTTGSTYYLTAAGGPLTATWETTQASIDRNIKLFGNSATQFTQEHYGHTAQTTYHTGLVETLPGSEGDLIDVHMSVWYTVEFVNAIGTIQWFTLFPDNHWHVFTSYGGFMQLYSSTEFFPENLLDFDNELTYTVTNNSNNSITIQNAVQWADTGQFEKSIQIYNGSKWVAPSAWSVTGGGTGKPLLQLLAEQIMTLRRYPKRIYSGSFLSSIPNAENRIYRDNRYYLPLSASRNTDLDSFEGEFLEIYADPLIEAVDTIEPIGDLFTDAYGGDTGSDETDEGEPTITFEFETNEVITATSNLTEVDIVNTAGVFIQAGTTVLIINPSTGEQEEVVLTQDIDPTDTVMYFEAHVFTYSYPDASPIIPNVDSGYYYYYKDSTTATEISAPNFTFLDESTISPHDVNRRYMVYRNGVRIPWNPNASTPQEKIRSYYFTSADNEWNFHIGLEEEQIMIIAW